MESEVMEVLSAFVDGERVEPEALTEALLAPGAREALVDFIHLRGCLASAPEPSAGFVRRVRGRLQRSRLPRVFRYAAAAAVLALAALGAVDLGHRILPERSVEPPTPTRIVEVEWRFLEGR
jgi:negative regulator of sigma E activity